MSLGEGGLLGAVELGVVVLPGAHGAPATVAEVPLGEADAVVELVVPLFAVAEVLPVEGVLLAVVDVPMLPLLEGVHGATVVEVPVVVWVVP